MTIRAFVGFIVALSFVVLVRWAYLEMSGNTYPKSAIGFGFMIWFICLTALAVIYVFIEIRAKIKTKVESQSLSRDLFQKSSERSS